MNEIKSKLRKVRIIRGVLILVIPMLAWVAEMGRSHGSSDWTWRHWLVAGLALWAVSGGFHLRRRLAPGSGETLRKGAPIPKPLRQWEARQITSLAMAEGVAWWGLVVRVVLGGAFWQASLFYTAALFLLLLWTPREPIASAST